MGQSRDYFVSLYHEDDASFKEAPPKRVDWRWGLVTELVQLREAAARVMLENKQDPGLASAYDYFYMVNAGFDAGDEFKAVSGAYDLFMNRPKQRRIVEGLLLCDPEKYSFEWIAKQNGFDVATIHGYATLFFDVRPHLDEWAWVFEMLFQNSLYDTISGRDSLAQAHRIAWLCGAQIFQAYINPKQARGPEVKAAMIESLMDMYYKQSFVSSFVRGNYSERDLKQVEVVVRDIQDEAKKALGGSEDLADSVISFLQSAPLTVADPSVESNLQLPAREPRIAEHIELAQQNLEATQ